MYKTLIFILTLFAMATPCTADWSTQLVFNGKNGKTLNYYLYTPQMLKGVKSPLVIWLHGGVHSRGSDPYDMPADAFYKPDDQKAYPSFILRPIAIKEENWTSPDSYNLLIELMDKVLNEQPVDPTRQYLLGASMGGYGVWKVLEKFPNRFAAAVPICGGGDATKTGAIKSTRIWIFHSADDTVIAAKESREMFIALMKNKNEKHSVRNLDDRLEYSTKEGAIKYTEYKSGGHNAWDRVMSDGAMKKWLFASKPAHIKSNFN
jgi:predicted peptidase